MKTSVLELNDCQSQADCSQLSYVPRNTQEVYEQMQEEFVPLVRRSLVVELQRIKEAQIVQHQQQNNTTIGSAEIHMTQKQRKEELEQRLKEDGLLLPDLPMTNQSLDKENSELKEFDKIFREVPERSDAELFKELGCNSEPQLEAQEPDDHLIQSEEIQLTDPGNESPKQEASVITDIFKIVKQVSPTKINISNLVAKPRRGRGVRGRKRR